MPAGADCEVVAEALRDQPATRFASRQYYVEAQLSRDDALHLIILVDEATAARISAQTANANGLEPYANLRRLFERLPHAKTIKDFAALLPFSTFDRARQ